MITTSRAVVKMSTPDTAAVRTSSVVSSMLHIRIGSTSVSGPARNSETDTLSSEAMKAMKAPARMPGRITGRVTRRNV